MPAASDEFFARFRYWLVSGGMITRSAWGMITLRSVGPSRSPSERAASVWPWLTERMPERTISAMNAAV
ncbi:hypothetical protein D3C73_1539320 [compost metagenome]